MRTVSIVTLLLITLLLNGQPIPLPEHPRPDFERELWQNLNGEWEFEFDKGNMEAFIDDDVDFSQTINVPFPWGSPLSGIQDKGDIGWYKREIQVDPSWKGKRIYFTIGASDWETTVWIDGHKIGSHQGGYVPFSFEITEYIDFKSPNRILVKADDIRRDFTLYGKQGYGNARGIWQTVYLEARGNTHFDAVHFTPNIDDSTVTVTPYLPVEIQKDTEFTVTIQNSFTPIIQKGTIKAGKNTADLKIEINNPILWNLDNPHLYEVTIQIDNDKVKSYFGMRKISVVNLPGTDYPYIALNNKPFYLQLALDQSYHPEGFYTFPSDEFMKNEILLSKSIGLNGIRPHIKVEIPRKLYWADKLGLLIMQDLPNSWGEPNEKMRRESEIALRAMIKRDYNHPSIFSWIVFNETWGLFSNQDGEKKRSYLPETQDWVSSMYYLAKSLDQTRLVEDNSVCCGIGHTETDINSFHSYLPGYEWNKLLKEHTDSIFPGSTFLFEDGFKQEHQPFINSECGNVWGYEGSAGDVDWSYDYHRMINTFRMYPKCAGWLYTEHHDVINEWNGYWRFDRSEKFTGFEQLVDGMSLNDLHADVMISTGKDICFETEVDKIIQIPVYISSMTDQKLGRNLTVKYVVENCNKMGTISQVASGSFSFDYKSYLNEKLPSIELKFDEPGLAILKLFLKDNKGEIINRNFAHIKINGEANNHIISSVPVNQYTNSAWTVKEWNVLDGLKVNGSGKGYFEYELEIPQVNSGKIDEAYILFEASAKQLFDKDKEQEKDTDLNYMRGAKISPHANPNAYPMTDEVMFNSDLCVSINGEEVYTTTLKDDPADSRGVLSWFAQPQDRKLREAGSYGYIIKVPIKKSQLKTYQKQGKITIILESKDSGGLAIYGKDFGRYPFDLSVIIKTKQ